MPEKKPFIFPKKPRGCCFGGGGGSTVAGIGVGVRGDARAMASLFRRGVGGGCRALGREEGGAGPLPLNLRGFGGRGGRPPGGGGGRGALGGGCGPGCAIKA